MGRDNKTILVAEDVASINRLIAARLRKAGYRVLATYDGNEALEAIFREPVDLALINMMMPHFDGSQVLRRIRAAHIDIPVIIFSVKTQESFLQQCLHFGANDYLVKPFQLEELLAKIDNLLMER